MNDNNLEKKYDILLNSYLDSQSYAYVLISILFITKNFGHLPIYIFGWVFFAISVALIIAPLNKIIKKFAVKIDSLFQGGLFIGSIAAIMIDGWIGSLKANDEFFFWTLVAWIGFMVISHSFRIAKRIGIYKLISFGLAGFGLLMMTTGHNTTIYQMIACLGFLLSIPAIDDICNEKM